MMVLFPLPLGAEKIKRETSPRPSPKERGLFSSEDLSPALSKGEGEVHSEDLSPALSKGEGEVHSEGLS